MNCDHYYRVLLLGEPGVGKTSLLTRYMDKTFYEDTVYSTTERLQRIKGLDCDGLIVDLEFWDLPGDRVDESILADLNGAIFCYSINDKDSFSKLSHWMEQVDRFSSDMICKVLVGSKSDLDRAVEKATAKDLAENRGIPFIETSAKTGTNIRAAFTAMAKELLTNEYPWGKYDDIRIHLDDGENLASEDTWSIHTLEPEGPDGGLCCVLV